MTLQLHEIAQILSCENLEEVENYLNERTDLIVNKVVQIADVKDLLNKRIDLPRDKLNALLKNY